MKHTPVAWRRTDTPRTSITENEDIMRGWAADGLFFEPLYAFQQMADMQSKIDRLENEIEMAEHQLTGFAHAKAGHSIEALADGMGLTVSEWQEIKARGTVRLDDCDADALSAYLGR